MTSRFQKLLFAGALSLWSCIASAGPLHYEFVTTLNLDAGPDTYGLNGATMHFAAEIAEGTTFAPDPIFGFQTFIPVSHEWTISGSGSLDGSFADPLGAVFAVGIGWFGHGGAYFNNTPFNTDSLGIYQGAPDPIVNTGDLVGPEHFGSFPQDANEAPWILWQTNDGSRYDWTRDVHFTVTELGDVPAPSSMALTSLALGIAAWFSTRRRLIH